jgi:hypothetical protein
MAGLIYQQIILISVLLIDLACGIICIVMKLDAQLLPNFHRQLRDLK